MKRYLKLTAVLLILYYGCTKTAPESEEEAPQTGCKPAFPGMNVTYENYVKNVIAINCTRACHKGGNSMGPGNFTSYAGVRAYVDKFPARVISDQADMPMGRAPLPKSTRDSLNAWIGNCSPEGL
ncbi:MAG: hypothetical protein ACO1NU_01410 [Arcticibacter sp.]